MDEAQGPEVTEEKTTQYEKKKKKKDPEFISASWDGDAGSVVSLESSVSCSEFFLLPADGDHRSRSRTRRGAAERQRYWIQEGSRRKRMTTSDRL